MGAHEMGYIQRERCGCVVAAVVEDVDTLHFVHTLSAWKRGKLDIERLPVETIRAQLGEAIDRADGRMPAHPGGWCEVKARRRERRRKKQLDWN